MSSSGLSCRALRPGKAMSRGRPRRRRCRPCSLRGPSSYCHQHCACGLPGRAATTSHRAISSRREWRPPGKVRSRRRASPSTTQGSGRSAGGPRLMPPRSYCLRIFGRNMAHFKTGRCLESKSVPVADVNVLLQLRQRYLWTSLRSCPSRLKRADPHHGRICIEEAGLAVPGQGRMELGICRPARLFCEPRGASLGAVGVCHVVVPHRRGRPCRRGGTTTS